jgi:hypothetical protein
VNSVDVSHAWAENEPCCIAFARGVAAASVLSEVGAVLEVDDAALAAVTHDRGIPDAGFGRVVSRSTEGGVLFVAVGSDRMGTRDFLQAMVERCDLYVVLRWTINLEAFMGVAAQGAVAWTADPIDWLDDDSEDDDFLSFALSRFEAETGVTPSYEALFEEAGQVYLLTPDR